MIAARIQANQRGRARAYHAQRYQRWCGVLATKAPRAQHLCGGIALSSPGGAPASPPANTTLNTHAILLGASSLTSAGVRRWRFYVPVHKISYRYFQPGCGRSWPERAKRQWCHQVCRRPPRRVEKASLLSSPGAPELQKSYLSRTALIKLSSTMCE